ncbi:MAG: glycosyltransferase family 39 protein [Elusimicrobiota bacterium]
MPALSQDARAHASWAAVLAIAFLAAVSLRFAGISYGLPAVFNADEPHHVNIAVSFARGSLNPGIFKYPTLWMYVLSCAYGAYFAVWSLLGGGWSPSDFGVLFVWHPGSFYLLARMLSAAFSLAGVWICACGARRLWGKESGLWAFCLLAVSPTLIESAHAAKPDSIMFCLASAAWFFAVRYFQEGEGRMLAFCGLFAGLAASSQYTAAPLALLPLSAESARFIEKRDAFRARAAAASFAAFAGGFFGGSPFILLDAPSFIRDMRDQSGIVSGGFPAGLFVLRNALSFSGHPWVGGILAAVGAAALCLRRRPLAILLLAAPAILLGLIASSHEGRWPRYQLAVFPAYALTAAWAARLFLPQARQIAAWAALLLMIPGGLNSWAHDREALLPDTRTAAAAWIEKNIRPGACILLDQEHASPIVRMSEEQVRGLYARTQEQGHPRARYYGLMLKGHPGGGYQVLRILRSSSDLHSGDWHSRWSALGKDSLDVREGLPALRRAGVSVVVLSSAGAGPERAPELRKFFEDLEKNGHLTAVFSPEENRSRGPVLRVYSLMGGGSI